MTTAVAAPATVPRPRRGAVGRRALQVVLFLGGLLALGLLFGARAQADQQPDPDLRPERQTVQGLLQQPVKQQHSVQQQPVEEPQPVKEQQSALTVAEPAARTAAQAAQAAHPVAPAPAADAPSAPTPRDVAHSVLSPVTEPVRDTVRQVTRPVGEAVERTVGTAVTGLRDITAALPAPAERPLPVPSLPAAPVPPQTGPAPISGAPADGAPDLPAAPRPGNATGTGAAPDGAAAVAAPHRGAAADHRPAPRGPFGPDGGQQGHIASAEVHPPRGGDQHAVPSADGTSFGLVSGAGLQATAAPVRDRSGDILEFPG